MRYKKLISTLLAFSLTYTQPTYAYLTRTPDIAATQQITSSIMTEISSMPMHLPHHYFPLRPSASVQPASVPRAPTMAEGHLFQPKEDIPLQYQKVLDQVIETMQISIVDVASQRFHVYVQADSSWTLQDTFLCSTSKTPGQKERPGDNKTPSGIIKVQDVQPTATWLNQGIRYGPWFCRAESTLDGRVFPGIGIHGTNEDSLLGRPASVGCIRLANNALEELVEKRVLAAGKYVGIIYPEPELPVWQATLHKTFNTTFTFENYINQTCEEYSLASSELIVRGEKCDITDAGYRKIYKPPTPECHQQVLTQWGFAGAHHPWPRPCSNYRHRRLRRQT